VQTIFALGIVFSFQEKITKLSSKTIVKVAPSVDKSPSEKFISKEYYEVKQLSIKLLTSNFSCVINFLAI
jgi:hypothetical protein